MDDPIFTESDAAHAWALAYNTHDPSALEPVLADDVRVMSRWVVNDLVGRDAYLGYLRQKFRTFEDAGSAVRVQVGTTPGGNPGMRGRPCALLEQDGSLLATVMFEVCGGRITQVSLSAHPSPVECLGSGLYPGFPGAPDPWVN